ncbi:MAG TPA: ribonuclease, partial [Propionibacteriaceae bacterium]|nr:ribonuclease [Propionibacteriaceae bacterium]
MLDNEPDTNTQPTTNAADPVDSPPPARRRRAAVRAAGPPGGTEGAPVIETVSSTPEHTTDEPTGPGLAGEGAPAQPPDLSTASEPPAPRTAAKRTRTTSPAKKAAAKKTATKVAESADSSGDSTAPPPRKRSSKKAAATAADGTPPAVAGPADTPQTDQRVDVPPHTAVSSVDEPATVDVQASPAAELKPSDESVGVVDAEQEQPSTDQEVVPPGDELPPFDDSLDGAEEGLDEATEKQAAVAGEEPARRRRRRRGGRRRRRGDDESDTEEARGPDNLELPSGDDIEQIADRLTEAAAVPVADEIAAGEDASERDDQRRRRRRRRRRGEDAGASPDDPSDVVVRVRESRRERSSQAVTGIEGSTRMEAKRQRRREGREAGRRRVPILSEAEFLARRESVTRNMIIRQREDLAQIAVLEDDILVEHYVDRDSAMSLIGNVYLGRVQNVLPSMEAAFIDIGRGRNAVLYAGEVDWDAFGA